MTGVAGTGRADGASPRRVLVADDDLMTRKVLSTVLDLEGYVAVLAEDGEEALALLREGGLDAAVLDQTMPGHTGLAVLAALRAAEATATLPVVLLTAVAAPRLDVDPLEAGADAFIAKPFSPLHLVEVLDELLGDR